MFEPLETPDDRLGSGLLVMTRTRTLLFAEVHSTSFHDIVEEKTLHVLIDAHYRWNAWKRWQFITLNTSSMKLQVFTMTLEAFFEFFKVIESDAR